MIKMVIGALPDGNSRMQAVVKGQQLRIFDTELHALQAIKIFKKDFNCLKGMEFI